jgi:hypothetical protein
LGAVGGEAARLAPSLFWCLWLFDGPVARWTGWPAGYLQAAGLWALQKCNSADLCKKIPTRLVDQQRRIKQLTRIKQPSQKSHLTQIRLKKAV